MTEMGVRRGKTALSSGCKPHPPSGGAKAPAADAELHIGLALLHPWTDEIAVQQAWEAALGLDGQRGAAAVA